MREMSMEGLRIVSVPSRRAGESPLSYLTLVAEAQGYPHHRWMFELAGGKASGSLATARNRDGLARVLGVDLEELLLLRNQARGGEVVTEARVGSAWFPLRYLDLEGARVCVACLSQREFRHALWDIKAFTCCPEHHVRLLETCPTCRRAPRVNAHGLRHCACGADLTENRPVPASEPDISLHQWLAYLAGFGARPTSGALTALGDDLDQLMAKDLVDLAVVLGWSRDGRDPLALLPARKAADWTQPVRKGADLLANWPEALHGAIRKKLVPDFDAFLRHRESLSELYAASTGRFREKKFDFLRVALDQVESAQWSDFASRFRRSLPEPVARRNTTAVGARSLAKDLGLTEHEVIQLARDGVLPTVTSQETGGRLDWLFDSDLSKEVFWDLDHNALPVPDDGFITGLPFYKARHIPRSPLLLAHLIRLARNGTIPILGGVSRSRGLKDCIFSQRHLLEAAISQLKRSNGQVATDAAWAYLGMTRQAWCWLQKKGYLRKALRMPVGAEMSVSQLWELLDKIVVPGNVIFGARTGLPQGRAALDRIGAIPFASSANGSPGVLYWRRDIERKLTSYLAGRR